MVFFRHKKTTAFFISLFLSLQMAPAFAVNPDEVLSDQALEKRARTLSAGLRCMVCQNESIDDSNAELARDLRILVRDRLTAGDSDQDVLDYVVDRYGEFVLLKPRLNTRTVLLWGFPVVLLLIGGSSLLVLSRRKKVVSVNDEPLTEAEEKRLKQILKENK
ncbi:cytochrome c-type biogenesis protein CcmH [Paenochrobactrum gallinarii]|uniref:Cytochrome c-type biogenesis protein n=1 Tax=Paenochrobactrum gallinarii TaxID=643673 RepID=A0A841M2B6_9HYPH|nr:cytochrome c-type biogenesis protein [Paenochrobactrum gallinarii]MBB6260298.1 cytochrome c-type biogenesis protein CcmH [Paenochrobactrum gallinarii]